MDFVLRCVLPVQIIVGVELIGRRHTFKYGGRRIDLRLPSEYSGRLGADFNDKLGDRARGVRYRKNDCIEVSVREIDVAAQIFDSDKIVLNEAMVTSAANPNHLFGIANVDGEFRAEARKISGIVTQAFEYWCRVARWKSGHWHIGLPVAEHDAHPGFRHIAAVDPHVHICAFNDTVNVYRWPAVSLESWNNIQKAVDAEAMPPIWIDFFFSAKRKAFSGELIESLVDCAIAAETFVRNNLVDSLGAVADQEPEIRRLIERWHISDVLGKFKKIKALKRASLSKTELGQLQNTFKLRNLILHRGKRDITFDEVDQSLKVVSRLIGV